MKQIAKPLLQIAFLLLLEFSRQFGLGVDWGSEFHKSTMLLPKQGFKMVENSISKRKTPSILSLCGDERFFESQAFVKFPRPNCESFYLLNRFFDFELSTFLKSLTDTERYFYETAKPLFDKHSAVFASDFAPLKTFQRNSTLDLLEKSKENAPERYLRLEEVFAMMLDIEKDNAFKTGQMEFKEGIFTIWDNSLSVAARKRLESAIALAGIKPLGFVHENAAAAVYWSIDRKPESASESENVLFVNIGSLGTKLSLVKFHAANETLADNSTRINPAVSVLADEFSGEFNGHLLDVCLGEFALLKQIQGIKRAIKPGEITNFKRRRLYNEIKRAKEMLTVNREISFYVEDFFDDRHLNVKLTRSEFEENCKEYFESLSNFLAKFLEKTKKPGWEFTKAEIVGGTVRIPKVQEIVKEVSGIVPGSHINGDEGMAFGAAFIAANFSAGIRTKKIILNDGPNYEIDLHVKFPEKSSQQDKHTVLFPFKTNSGTKKKMNIKKLQEDVKMTLKQKAGDFSVEYAIEGVTKALEKFANKTVVDWKVDFHFELDGLGIPKLLASELQLKENVTEIVNKTLPKTNKTENDTEPAQVVQETKHKVVVHNTRLNVSVLKQSCVSLKENKQAFEESRSLLKLFKAKEVEKQKRSAIKNELESFIYRLNSEAEDKGSTLFLTNLETAKFKEKAEEIDSFLFSSEAESAELAKFESLIKEVNSLLSPLSFRKDEYKEKDLNWKIWNEFYKNVTNAFADLQKNKPWIPEEKMEEAVQKATTTHSQVEEFYKQQMEMPLNIDPVFNKKMLAEKLKGITVVLEKLDRIPKPKPAEKPKDDLDKAMDEVLRNMKSNFTGANFTKEQIEEMLEKLKKMKVDLNDTKQTGEENEANVEDHHSDIVSEENMETEETGESEGKEKTGEAGEPDEKDMGEVPNDEEAEAKAEDAVSSDL